eukprot:TRINITY_DN239_c0_g6_i1.p1 TRINITY_DN239_c0_g6~~TRINITY_DN239_c0_g6_i1.p1  ORF type:complete len:338 (+),score=68.92 TRINITY_DN239_c0_g6_i1:54-1067(+)
MCIRDRYQRRVRAPFNNLAKVTSSSFVLFFALAIVFIAFYFQQTHNMALREARREFGDLSLSGRHAIVVGGTAGIGQGLALRLARANVSVTVCGRNSVRGADVVSQLARVTTDPDVTHRFTKLDASLMSDCKRFAKSYDKPVDYLVMTQGIASMDGFTPTAEGIDRKLAVHYYSRVALATAFADKLEKSQDGRILSVLSAGVHSPYAGYESDFTLEKTFSLSNAANAAGFYNDIFTEKMNEVHPNVAVIHAAPGFVASDWGSTFPWYLKGPTRFFQLFATSIGDCGELLAVSLFRKDMAGKASLVDRKSQPVEKTALHDTAKDSVWASTLALLGKFE